MTINVLSESDIFFQAWMDRDLERLCLDSYLCDIISKIMPIKHVSQEQLRV